MKWKKELYTLKAKHSPNQVTFSTEYYNTKGLEDIALLKPVGTVGFLTSIIQKKKNCNIKSELHYSTSLKGVFIT